MFQLRLASRKAVGWLLLIALAGLLAVLAMATPAHGCQGKPLIAPSGDHPWTSNWTKKNGNT